MVDLEHLLCCPVCRGDLVADLRCSRCSREYGRHDGIYLMLDAETSACEWKWDARHLEPRSKEERGNDYGRYLNRSTIEAHQRWWAAMRPRVDALEGYVLDIASGLGGMFEILLESGGDFIPIASDVDPNVIALTAGQMRLEHSREFGALVADAKHLALKDGHIDAVVSLAGLGNIPEPALALAEMRRVLRDGGRLTVMQMVVDEGTPSAALAAEHRMADTFTEASTVRTLESVGFSGIEVAHAGSAIWAENPNDLLPVAGDTAHYVILEATR